MLVAPIVSETDGDTVGDLVLVGDWVVVLVLV